MCKLNFSATIQKPMIVEDLHHQLQQIADELVETRINQDQLDSQIKQVIAKDLEFIVEHPRQESFGDYSTNLALRLAPILKQSPIELAEEIMTKLGELPQFAKAEVAPPGFINLWLKKQTLVEEIDKILTQKKHYGTNTQGDGKVWEIEHSSPNPNKAMHLGHLRNNITGMALVRLSEACGIRVISDAVDNNRGIAIAKLMWGFLKFARKNETTPVDINYWYDHQDEWLRPEDKQESPDKFMDKLYTLGAQDYQDEAIKPIVKQMVIDWEAKDEKIWSLWRHVLSYVYQGQQQTLKRLGNRHDKVWHEHEHYEAGKKWVERGLKQGVFQKLDDGLILTDLESYGLPNTVVQKSDGTSLYITQDIALTDLKKKTYQAEKLFWVVGPEQSLAMRQLFAVCDQLNIGQLSEFTHLAYGYMSIRGQGKMSSRLGNVIYIDDLIDAVKQEVLNKMKSANLPKSQKNVVAEQVALGAIKYSILKVGRTTDMAFDLAAALSLEGDSGPYLQYTHARCQSVLRKLSQTEIKSVLSNKSKITEDKLKPAEINLLRWLHRYPGIVSTAAWSYSPNLIASYLNELAQRYNTFYNSHHILNEQAEIRGWRLKLTAAVGQVIANGLEILGISAPEKM